MEDFIKCVKVSAIDGGFEFRCRLGLWSVSGANKKIVESEARYYFMQYRSDGEYHSIIGGPSQSEVFIGLIIDQ